MTTHVRAPKGESCGETPDRLAKRLGIHPLNHRGGFETVTYDLLLTWAVKAYWRRRATKEAA